MPSMPRISKKFREIADKILNIKGKFNKKGKKDANKDEKPQENNSNGNEKI